MAEYPEKMPPDPTQGGDWGFALSRERPGWIDIRIESWPDGELRTKEFSLTAATAVEFASQLVDFLGNSGLFPPVVDD